MSMRKLNIYEEYLKLPSKSLRFNICFVLEYSGNLNRSLIRQAVDNLQDQHPALRSYVKDGVNLLTCCKKRIPIFEMKLEVDEEWLPIVSKELHRPFAHHVGPMCRIIHVLSNKKVHALLFTLDHLIADGISGTCLVKQLLDEIHSLQMQRQNGFSKYELPNFQNYCQDPIETSTKHLESRSLPFSGCRGLPTSTGILKRVLEQKETAEFLALCKSTSTSVHTMLLASALKTMYSKIADDYQIVDDIDVLHNTPVNLRQFLPMVSNNKLACFVGDICGKVTINSQTDILDLARYLENEISHQLKPKLVVETWGLISTLMKNTGSYDELREKKKWYGPMVSLSNMGSLSFQRNMKIELKTFFSFGALHGTLFSENNMVIMANTFNGKICFTFSYPKPLMKDRSAVVFSDSFNDVIKVASEKVTFN